MYPELEITDFVKAQPVYLASASPRRFELLRQIGFAAERISLQIDETIISGEQPAQYVERLAIEKASKGWHNSERTRDWPVIGADTSVVYEGSHGLVILGKPEDDRHAREILSRLSGREHRVLTGVAVCFGQWQASVVVTTRVKFAQLAKSTIDAYVASGEGRDKAGSYGIQGLAGQFVESISGSYSNVVGLPLLETRRLVNQVRQQAAVATNEEP